MRRASATGRSVVVAACIAVVLPAVGGARAAGPAAATAPRGASAGTTVTRVTTVSPRRADAPRDDRPRGGDAALARLYVRGVRRFDAGDWSGAEAAWDSLVAAGVRSADVWYNIGCAAFERGDLGRAVLAWERARRLAPRDADVRANLELARSLLVDHELVERPGRVRRLLTWVPDHLSDSEMHRLADAFFVLACALGVLLVWRRRPAVRTLWRRVSVVSPGRLLGLSTTGDLVLATVTAALLFGLTLGTVTWRERAAAARRDAIVTSESVAAYAAPDAGSTHQFDLHAGTRVRLGRTRGRWVEVRLPGDVSGWVRRDAVEAI